MAALAETADRLKNEYEAQAFLAAEYDQVKSRLGEAREKLDALTAGLVRLETAFPGLCGAVDAAKEVPQVVHTGTDAEKQAVTAARIDDLLTAFGMVTSCALT